MERRLPDMSARLGELLQGLKTAKRPRPEGEAALRRLHGPSRGGPGASPGERPREVRAPNVFLRGLRGTRRAVEQEEAAPLGGTRSVVEQEGAAPLQDNRRTVEQEEVAPLESNRMALEQGNAHPLGATSRAAAEQEEAAPMESNRRAVGQEGAVPSREGHAEASGRALGALGAGREGAGDYGASASPPPAMREGAGAPTPFQAEAAVAQTLGPSSHERSLPGDPRGVPPASAEVAEIAMLNGSESENRPGQAGAGGSYPQGPPVLGHAALRPLDSVALAWGPGAREGGLAERPRDSSAPLLCSLLAEGQGLRPDGRGAAGAAAVPAQSIPVHSNALPAGMLPAGGLSRHMPDGHMPGGILPGSSLPGGNLSPGDPFAGALPGDGVPGEAGEGGRTGDRQQQGQQPGHEGADFSDAFTAPLGSSYGPRRKALRVEERPVGVAPSRPSGGTSQHWAHPSSRPREGSSQHWAHPPRDVHNTGPVRGELVRAPKLGLQLSPHNVAAFLPTVRSLSGADMLACLDALYCAIADHKTAQARRLEREILFSSSPMGNAVQRMGLLFLRGLKLRASVGSSPMSNAELNQRLADAAPRITQAVGAAQRTYYKLVPLHMMAMAAACSALLDTFATQRRVHIVTLGYFRTTGSQHWTHLIRGLGTRPQGPPRSLRFTFVGLRFNLSRASSQEMRSWTLGLARELRLEAQSWGIREFEAEIAEIGDPGGIQELFHVEGRRDWSGQGPPRRPSPLDSASPRARRGAADGGAQDQAGTEGPEAPGAQGPLQCPPGLEEAFVREQAPLEASNSWMAPQTTGSGTGSGIGSGRSIGSSSGTGGGSGSGRSIGSGSGWGSGIGASREPRKGALSMGADAAPGLGDRASEVFPHLTPPEGGTAGAGEEGLEEAAMEWGDGEHEPEALGICNFYGLINLPDRYRPDLLQWIGMQHPDVFVVADMAVDQTAADPATRFQQCTRFYAPLLDLHDALLRHQRTNTTNTTVFTTTSNSTIGAPRGVGAQRGGTVDAGTGEEGEGGSVNAGPRLSTEDEVFLFEQFMYTRHVNGCVGSQRKMISTMGAEAWQEQMAHLGVAEVPWEPHTVDFIRRCLHGLPSDLHLRAYGGLVAFCWRGQPLYFVGKWTGLASPLHTVSLALTL